MKNKYKIELLQDLLPMQFMLSHLRRAHKIGDTEIINNTQLGNLKEKGIGFKII